MTRFKLSLFLFFIFVGLNSAFKICRAQAGEWIWIKGDSVPNTNGNYGIMGVPSLSNEPAPRYACASWTDTAGNFWVYSGNSLKNLANGQNDMWRFDPQTLMWTWMNGSPDGTTQPWSGNIGAYDSLYTPGSLNYGMFTWVTPDNHLWLYGGFLLSAQAASAALWQYDPAINQWAFMGNFGSSNNNGPVYGTMGVGDSTTIPGARQESNCAWTDSSGNLWLFGGQGSYGQDALGDMWEYNVSTGIWTWMGGSSEANSAGKYGIIGQSSDTIYPAARWTNLFWKDNTGDFWVAGGTQYAVNEMYQDIWKFDPKTLQWTWVKGSDSPDTAMIGSNCTPDTLDKEGGRYENRAVWKICDDLIINYEGYRDCVNQSEEVNDLWAYQVSRNEWIKINTWPSFPGLYGTQGTGTAGTFPVTRSGAAGFKDKDNNLWMFGGLGYNLQGEGGFYYNDLWKYVLDTACVGSLSCSRSCNLAPPVINANDSIFCANDSTWVCAPTGFTYYQWNAGVTGTGNCIEAKQAGDYYVNVTDSNGCSAESNHLSISVYPVPSVSIIQQGDTLSSYGAVDYQWYYNNNLIQNATRPLYIANQPGSYTLQITDTNGCTETSQPVEVVATGINNLEKDASVMLYPNPCSVASLPAGQVGVHLLVGNELIGSELEIYDNESRLVFQSAIRHPKSEIALTGLPSGVYYLRISSANASIVRKLVKL